MRDLTKEEIQTIAGANNEPPITPREAGGLLGAELGSRFGPGGVIIGGITGIAAGHYAEKYGKDFLTPPNLPSHCP